MNTWDSPCNIRVELCTRLFHSPMHAYVYMGQSHTRMELPIRVWDVPYAYIAIIIDQFTLKLQALTVHTHS